MSAYYIATGNRPGVYRTIENRGKAIKTTGESGGGGVSQTGKLTIADDVLIYEGGALPTVDESGVLVYSPTPAVTDDGIMTIN